MKKFKFWAVVFLLLILSVSSLSGIDEPAGHYPSKKERLAGQNLRYIKGIEVSIVLPEENTFGEDSEWYKLKTKVTKKLKKLSVFIPEPGILYTFMPPMSELKVNVGFFKPVDSEKYFCRTQIVLSRAVRLATEQNSEVFYADVWKSESLIGMADEPNDIPEKAVESALQLTEQFISDYKKANAKNRLPIEITPSYPDKPTPLKEESKIETARRLFVASKNSKVFHRTDCSAAKRIKPENVTNFSTAGDAIRAGLRPCKICGK